MGAHVPLQPPRFAVHAMSGGIRVSIPARRNWFTVLFSCVWLVGWVLGEVTVIREFVNPVAASERLFLVVWLLGWTLGGGFVLGTVLWQLGGKELIALDPRTFEHRIEAFGVGRSRRYALGDVRNLRIVVNGTSGRSGQGAWMPPLVGAGHGPLAFDYGARTFHLGSALDEAEATLLLRQLAPRFPRGSTQLE